MRERSRCMCRSAIVTLLSTIAVVLIGACGTARAQQQAPYIFVDLSLPGIILRDAGAKRPWLLKADALFNPRSAKNIAAQKQWQQVLGEPLNGALARFRNAGFDEPAIELNNPPGSFDEVYKVYLFPFNIVTGLLSGTVFPEASGLYGACFPFSRRLILLDLNDAYSTRDYMLTGYHELTHAIQASTPLFERGLLDDACFMPDWVTEGMANGVASYLGAETIGNFDSVRDNEDDLGVRDYQLPLHTKPDVDEFVSYRTGSFWRYLLERYGGLPTLAALMQKTMPTLDNLSLKSPLRWLDESLSDELGEGLDFVFPAFVAEFASYGGSRFKSLAIGGSREKIDIDDWLNLVLLGCRKVTLTPGETELLELKDLLWEARQGIAGAALEPVSAFCIDLRWDASQDPRYEEFLEVLTPDVRRLQQIHLGVSYMKIEGGGAPFRCHEFMKGKDYLAWPLPPCHLKVFDEYAGTGLYARRWVLEPGQDELTGTSMRLRGASGRKIYVLSNVAPRGKARQTKPITDLTVRIGLSKSEASDGRNLGPPESVPIKQPTIAPTEKQRAYGVNPARPFFAEGMVPIEVAEYGSPEPQPGEEPVAQYHVSPRPDEPMTFGEVGPFFGTVGKDTDGATMIASNLCTGGLERPIGQVLESTGKMLRVRVDTDLCEMDPAAPFACQGGCPVVDRFTATLSLPFGKRHYSDTMPVDIVTPGLKVYIDRYYEKLWEKHMSDPPASNPFSETATGDTGNSPGHRGAGGGGSASVRRACDCSCEAVGRLQARMAAGVPENERSSVAMCIRQCMPQMMACGGN